MFRIVLYKFLVRKLGVYRLCFCYSSPVPTLLAPGTKLVFTAHGKLENVNVLQYTGITLQFMTLSPNQYYKVVASQKYLYGRQDSAAEARVFRLQQRYWV